MVIGQCARTVTERERERSSLAKSGVASRKALGALQTGWKINSRPCIDSKFRLLLVI